MIAMDMRRLKVAWAAVNKAASMAAAVISLAPFLTYSMICSAISWAVAAVEAVDAIARAEDPIYAIIFA